MNSYKNENNVLYTFKDLYKFLQTYSNSNILEWLNEAWIGKDKQESLLRLFAGLGLIDKLNDFKVCNGNFNIKTIQKNTSLRDIFYNNKNLINLKDKGDSSDLTCIHNKDDKHILVTTSKNLNKTNIGKLDIDKILTNFQQYQKDNYTMSLCICIRNLEDFKIMKNGIEYTNKELKILLNKEDTIIIDWNDLNQSFNLFKKYFNDMNIEVILNSNKFPLKLKMHQELGVLQTLKIKNDKNNKNNKILWGHIQRSGKSYIIGGCIIEDSKEKDESNYLVITTAPKETIEQYLDVFNCLQLSHFNVITLNCDNKKPKITKKNIIVCSKQFLQSKIENNKTNEETSKSIAWLKKMKFEMRFIDESHNGATTQLAKKTLDYYGNNSFTIQITATYSKPINNYNISKENWILWDLEDIKLCKNLNDERNKLRLIEKHGCEIETCIEKYSMQNIINDYSNYPELHILTDELSPDTITNIVNSTKDSYYGWSSDACFLLKQGIKNNEIIIKEEFQNEKETIKMWYRIFGKSNSFDIPDKDYPDNIVFMKRIEKICKNPVIDSRFIGDTEEPMIIMAFLPQNNIDKISSATMKLLQKYDIIPEFEIVSINSKITNNPKQLIEETRIKAKNGGKKGVLVLSGRQCSLGISIHNCDIVLLLNNNNGFDMIYQMMFRCMTEGYNKKCGFIVDLNIHRVIETSIIDYASLIKPNSHPKNATQYILQERLINLNSDHWMQCFGNNPSKIKILSESVYNIYSSNTEIALKHFLNRLSFKEVLLSKDENIIFNSLFNNKITKPQKDLIYTIFNEAIDDNENIKKGIEKTQLENKNDASPDSNDNNDEEYKKFNYMDILKHIIPLVCLLTIHDEESSFEEMYNIIQNDEYIYTILLDQTKSWWGENIDTKIINKFINIYNKYMKNDKETNQIIRTVKEIFSKNINNNKDLSVLIDKYFIPQELEKKNNAEVSTPFKLRQEMLDKMPVDFWTTPKKVFEPCSGKGGFVIDIIDRFMTGLKELIPNEKERYKIIVEDCLYFSDINPTNIFICKLLIDPYNKYKLHFNEGDTLELNIQKKWGINGFDAVIGNPPYNPFGNTGTGNTIWQKFTKKSLNNWLNSNGYLVFVHPPGWRKPNTEKGKFYGLYKLMTNENQLVYLSIHGIKDGQQTFKCGTRYDWYIIEKKQKYKNTYINDEKKNKLTIDMNYFNWLPNYNIDIIQNILAKKEEERCPIIYDRTSYGADKKDRVSCTKDEIFKYSLIHSTPQKGIRYMYSKINNKGHFGVSKIIFGESGIYNPIIDVIGKYGMTHGAMYIKILNEEEGNNIKKALTCDTFKDIIKSCTYSSFRIDWNIFKDMKKDFWKEFI